MRTRFIVLLGLVSASACAAIVSACGGTSTTDVDGGGDATTDSLQTNDTGTNPDAPPGNEAGPPDAGGCAKGTGCGACCAAQYPEGGAVFREAERSCACTTPGDCKGQTVCGGSLCSGVKPSFACEACLNDKDAGDCAAVAAAACAANAECAGLASCLASCGSFDAGGGG